MKKLVSVIAAAALMCGALCFVACEPAPEEENITSYVIDATLDTSAMTVAATEKVTYVNSGEADRDGV